MLDGPDNHWILKYNNAYHIGGVSLKNHIYDPEFKGSFSIKKVLPALVKGILMQIWKCKVVTKHQLNILR